MADGYYRKIDFWKKMWDTNEIYFHKLEVHKMLQKYESVLFQEGKKYKVFVPLCGKTLDMKWLSDRGHSVVGLDGVKKALEDFYEEHGMLWTEEDVPNMGQECKVLTDKDSKFRLYFGDINLFNNSVENEFDCVWDRGAHVALNTVDVKRYAEMIKDILKPNGKILFEAIEYDIANYADLPMLPPAHPVFEDEVRSLFEPECAVERIDSDSRLLKGKEAELVYYLIVKK